MAESPGTPQPDRRCSSRLSCAGGVEILQHGSRWGWGRVNDISHSGCYIEMIQLLPVGSLVQLRLTIANILLEIASQVASNDPGIGMGMKFIAPSQEQEATLTQIVSSISGSKSFSPQQTDHPQPSAPPPQITREAAPDILAKVIKQINQKGLLTRQDLIDIVKGTK